MRWPETKGEPICLRKDCGSLDHWWLENQRRWKCKAPPSRTFGGYYQFGAANLFRSMDDNPFAGWVQ